MRKLTTEEFIERSNNIHNNKYDYSNVDYQGNRYKVKIKCPTHGLFEQGGAEHLKGGGCRKCASLDRTHTYEDFLKITKKVHGNLYEYPYSEYMKSSSKVDIICKKHGLFQQISNSHLSGRGCPKCSRTETPELIERFKEVHGNKYDYSKTEYINSYKKVIITCKIHGDFKQSSGGHLNGSGCQECGKLKLRNDFDYFLKKSKEIHGNLYKYPYDDYITSTSLIRIICPTHGLFEQSANSHLCGKGCLKCAGKNITTSEIIKRFKHIHGNKYDYSKVEYINATDYLTIICPKHGEFLQSSAGHSKGNDCPKCVVRKKVKTLDTFIKDSRKVHGDLYEYIEYNKCDVRSKIKCRKHGVFKQTPSNHLQGAGCPKCINIISKPEIEVANFVESLNLEILTSKRNIIKPYELDIFIPSLNKAIEFNGTYWHYTHSNSRCKPRGYHAMKSNLCREKGIKLLHIREDLWLKNKDKMKEVIKKFINEKTR